MGVGVAGMVMGSVVLGHRESSLRGPGFDGGHSSRPVASQARTVQNT
jgi:hypothetical protein